MNSPAHGRRGSRIAVIYPTGTPVFAWCRAEGMVHTLRAMGHQVLDVPQSSFQYGTVNWWDLTGELNRGDLVVLSAPEYACWQQSYGGFRTGGIDFSAALARVKVPKFGIYGESRDMEGGLERHVDFPGIFKRLLPELDHHFYPAAQDAEELGKNLPGRCHWLPFSADTDTFYPQGLERPFELGFIGNMYQKRGEFLAEFFRIIPSGGRHAPVIGRATVESIDGIKPQETARMLAYSYNRIRIFTCFPAQIQTMMSKVTEAMACRCCVLAPRLEGRAARNMEGFEHGKDLFFYDGTPRGMYGCIDLLLNDPDLAKEVAFNATTSVLRNHTLRARMESMLSNLA